MRRRVAGVGANGKLSGDVGPRIVGHRGRTWLSTRGWQQQHVLRAARDREARGDQLSLGAVAVGIRVQADAGGATPDDHLIVQRHRARPALTPPAPVAAAGHHAGWRN